MEFWGAELGILGGRSWNSEGRSCNSGAVILKFGEWDFPTHGYLPFHTIKTGGPAIWSAGQLWRVTPSRGECPWCDSGRPAWQTGGYRYRARGPRERGPKADYHRGNTGGARGPRPKRTRGAPLALKPPQPDGRPGGGHDAERRRRVSHRHVQRLDVRASGGPLTALAVGGRPEECKCPLPHTRG